MLARKNDSERDPHAVYSLFIQGLDQALYGIFAGRLAEFAWQHDERVAVSCGQSQPAPGAKINTVSQRHSTSNTPRVISTCSVSLDLPIGRMAVLYFGCIAVKSGAVGADSYSPNEKLRFKSQYQNRRTSFVMSKTWKQIAITFYQWAGSLANLVG